MITVTDNELISLRENPTLWRLLHNAGKLSNAAQGGTNGQVPPRPHILLFLLGFLFFVVADGSPGCGTSYRMSATDLVSRSSADSCALSRTSVRLLLSGNSWDSASEGKQSSKKNTWHHFGFLQFLSRTRDNAIPQLKTITGANVWQNLCRGYGVQFCTGLEDMSVENASVAWPKDIGPYSYCVIKP